MSIALKRIAAMALVFGTWSVHAEEATVPDLEAAIQQYQEQSKEKYAKMPAETKQLMADAKQDLAARMPDPGLKVGDKAPDFTLQNAFGKPIQLSEQLKQGPVIVTFYRGAWCPFCNLQLRAYQQAMPVFEQYGASLIAITPQTPDRSVEQLEKTPLDFEVVSDLDSAVMKAYRLHFTISPELNRVYQEMGLDIAAYNGEGRLELPVPGTFVIGRKGVIQAKFADPDYTKRMEPRDIIAALDKLKK